MYSSKTLRRLTIFAIALPMGIIVFCNHLHNRPWANTSLIKWTTIVAGFWWIGGMLATGIYILWIALRRQD
jgi:formate-dependent nitrite reductase membrane component NrfD